MFPWWKITQGSQEARMSFTFEIIIKSTISFAQNLTLNVRICGKCEHLYKFSFGREQRRNTVKEQRLKHFLPNCLIAFCIFLWLQ